MDGTSDEAVHRGVTSGLTDTINTKSQIFLTIAQLVVLGGIGTHDTLLTAKRQGDYLNQDATFVVYC